MSWTRALHFKSWADTQDARHSLPLLIRRLVRAIVPSQALVVFPAAEQVQRPGLDGIVEVTAGNQFVPTGKSAWEMGVNRDVKGKADEDFDKRTLETAIDVRKESTFVFVMPREWRNKDEWAEDKKKSGDWKDVRALDANDLEHWIELCPAVDVWYSTVSGRRPEGVLDLTARWKAFSRIAAHELTPQVVLTGREGIRAELLKWFDGEARSILLRSESADDAQDFLSALAHENADVSRNLERMVVVSDISAWRALSINREPIILVASAQLALHAEDIAEAVAAGHHVLICGGRTASQLAPDLRLPRQDAQSITAELERCGFGDSSARSLALGCCGSSSILKRLLTQHPQTTFPEWSRDEHRPSLAAFALLGGWVHVHPAPEQQGLLPTNTPMDLICVEDFVGISREALESHIARWSSSDEPLFLRFGKHVVIASREDAWFLLGSAITPQVLQRFEDLASLVLDEDNPALDLKSEDRWMASIYGKTHSLSGELREGILESLVFMAVYPTAGVKPFEMDFKATVRRILDRVLPAGTSWKRWATFDRHLQLFAEADPDFLLSRIETDLDSNAPQIPELFKNGGTGLFSSSLHCGLLWALEKMAWNPALLGRVTRVLARLVEIEGALPGNMGNRPSNTLRGIYLWWLPHTNATVDERIAELRQLINRHPDVGWSFLIEMLPSGTQSICDPTEMPRWRDWAVGWSREKVHREIPRYALAIADLVVVSAADDPHKWSQILNGIFRFSADVTKQALQGLKELTAHCDDVLGRSALWKSLRDLVSRHRAYPDSSWAFEEELLQELSAICDQLEPSDAVVLNEWLFNRHPDLPDISVSKGFERYHAELEARRATALSEIVLSQGWSGVVRLIRDAHDVNTIGWLVGRNGCLSPVEISLWELFESTDRNVRTFAGAYVAGSFNAKGFGFLDELGLRGRTPEQSASATCALPFDRPTWDWLDSHLDQDAVDAYWRSCRGLVRSERAEDLTFVIERLLRVCRPFTAADILQMAVGSKEVAIELIYRVLEAGLSAEQNQEELGRIDTYATQQLIKHLQEHSTDQLPRLARLEWGYLPVLDRHSSEAEPTTLLNELQTSPPSFVELLKVVYRGSGEEPRQERLSEVQRAHLRHARELLEAFSQVPGADSGGNVDEHQLVDWITQVRSLAQREDRLGVADIQIGQLLSRVPIREHQDWPPVAICRAMEECSSDDIFEGFIDGLISGREATMRLPTMGGQPERDLAASYRAIAAGHQVSFPKVASALRSLADYYDRYAEREDEDAERRRLER